jgi:glycosyltransferase involved in cell wall biosynthesis
MKIAYVVRQIDSSGGRERVLTNKVNYFVKNYGYEVSIITMFQREAGCFYELDERIDVHHLNLTRKEFFSGGKIKYRNYVKHNIQKVLFELLPDVTISMWWGVDFKVLPFINDGSRKILEFHFSQYMRNNLKINRVDTIYRKFRLKVTRWIENRLVNKYDTFIILTNEDKENWVQDNVVVIPNSLTFKTHKTSPCSSKVVLAVGRLTEEKGFDRLLKIWSAVEDDFPDWSLHIYGDGDKTEKEILNNLMAVYKLKNVKIFPASKNIMEIMLEASVFAFTSRNEGFGMVLIESMQCGVPVISYDTKCGPRDIIEDGISGYIVNEGDETAFAHKLTALMNNKNLRIKMGSEGKKRSNENFSEEIIMAKWKNLFENNA